MAEDRATETAGKMTEALETLERARGHLYSFHQLVGEADCALDAVLEGLRAEGQAALADELQRELVGRDVIDGHWTFQIIEDFDGGYWDVFRASERKVRDALVDGERHAREAQLKRRRQ